MRCPDCNQRNSVAAKKCAACGSGLRRKPMPLGFKAFIGTLVGIVFVFWLAALSSTINNPEKNLTSTASTLTGKSNSAEQMMGNIKNFDEAMYKFLQKYGSLGNSELTSKLSITLPKSLYENHVFEILPNLKLVEIDTALNASSYLVLLSNGQTKVLPITGLGVYDSNSFLPQNDKSDNGKQAKEGQLLVLLGHTTSMHGHQPRVKVFLLSSTLQSDSIVDLTDTAVPKLYGEGTAKFSPNQKDIELSISLLSLGQELSAFPIGQLKASLPVENEALYEQLIWQNNAYSLHSQPGTSKLYTLYAVADALKNHNKLIHVRGYFSPVARRALEQTPIDKSEQGFVITSYKSLKKSGGANNIYILKNDSLKAVVELKPLSNGKKGSGNGWFVSTLSITKLTPGPHASIPAATPTNLQSPQKNNKDDQKDKTNPAAEVTKPTQPETEEKIKTVKTEETKKEIQKTSAIATPTEQGVQASFARDLKANVKLRNGPGTTYESIYEIKPSQRVSILDKQNGWYRVKVDDKEGFIYAGLIANQKNNGYRSALIKQNCTVKDDEQHAIMHISRGDHLILVDGPQNDRYKIMLSDGKIGYVKKEAIDGAPRPVRESPPPFVP